VVIGQAGPESEVSLRRDSALFRSTAIRTVVGAPIMLPGPDDERLRWFDAPVGMRRIDFEQLISFTVAASNRLRHRWTR
jgi:hypothetical protein